MIATNITSSTHPTTGTITVSIKNVGSAGGRVNVAVGNVVAVVTKSKASTLVWRTVGILDEAGVECSANTREIKHFCIINNIVSILFLKAA